MSIRIASLSLLLLAAPALGQATGTPIQVTPQPRQAPNAPPPVQGPPEVMALKQQLDDLDRYLRRKGSVTKDDRPALVALQGKLAPFAAQKEPLALAMQVQIATWLDDPAQIDAAYTAVLAARPGNEIALAQWFSAINRRNDFEHTVNEASARQAEVAASVRASLPVIDALIALNRIGDAKARLDALTPKANEALDVAGKLNAHKMRLEALSPLWQIEDALRQTEEKAGTLPRVELVTSKGPIVVELFEDQAPNSVAAFLSFVEGGNYAGTSFSKRVPGLGLVGGDPNSKAGATGRPGFGSPGFRLPDEAGKPERRMALAGTIGFAKADSPPTPTTDGSTPPRTVKDSAGQTFFFLTTPAEHLHGECTIFGRIVSGAELLSTLAVNDRIESAKVLRKREHPYEVTKAPELTGPVEVTLPPVAAPRPPAMPGQPGLQPTPIRTPTR